MGAYNEGLDEDEGADSDFVCKLHAMQDLQEEVLDDFLLREGIALDVLKYLFAFVQTNGVF